MSLNPLAPVADYPTMLNRIFWFTTASAVGAVWLLRTHLPAIDAALATVDLAVASGLGRELPAPGGTLLPALVLGIATRIFRLHARAADLLGIREYFDVEVLLAELAEGAGFDLSALEAGQLQSARHRLMRRTFYDFVGGPRAVVDRLLVEQALDAWSWFWIGVESAILWTATGLGLIAAHEYSAGFGAVAAAILASALVLPALHGECRRFGAAQVRAILADEARTQLIRAAFAELLQPKVASRKAA